MIMNRLDRWFSECRSFRINTYEESVVMAKFNTRAFFLVCFRLNKYVNLKFKVEPVQKKTFEINFFFIHNAHIKQI